MNPAILHNIEHLHLAAHQNCDEPKLVANWDSTYIYVQDSWLGRLWTWFYRGIVFLGYGDSSNEKLLKSIEKTFRLFLEHYESFEACQNNFERALSQRMNERDVDENIFHLARASFISWQAIFTCWDSFLKDENTLKLQERLKVTLGETFSSLPTSLFASHQFSRIFLLEGYLKQPLPVALLKRLACAQELSELYQEHLSRFIQKVNNHQQISVRLFSKALKELVMFYNATKSGVNADLLALKVALACDGCSIFSKEDEKHKQWVSSLKPGAILNCGSKEYALGKKLDDNFDSSVEMYAVDSNPSIAVCFAKNREWLSLRERLAQESWGIDSAAYIDRCCHFSVVERLCKPLITIKWASKEKLIEDDENLLKPIRERIEWYVRQGEHFPDGLNVRTLGFNTQGELKCSQVVTKGGNFNQLVEFAICCANGNRLVYKHLAEPIKKHNIARFYQGVVSNCLSEKPEPLKAVMDAYGLPKEAKNLIEQARKLESEIRLTRTEFPIHYSSLDQLTEGIKACYEQECYIGYLSHDFNKKVLEYLPKRRSLTNLN